MNIAIFTGRLMSDAQILSFNQNNEDDARVAVAFKVMVKNRNNKRSPLIVQCISFERDHRLDVVVEKLVKDQMVTVTGDVFIKQFEEDDGFVYSCFALELHSMDIHYLPKPKVREPRIDKALERLVSDVSDDNEGGESQASSLSSNKTNNEVPPMDIDEAQKQAMLFQDDDGVNTNEGTRF